LALLSYLIAANCEKADAPLLFVRKFLSMQSGRRGRTGPPVV